MTNARRDLALQMRDAAAALLDSLEPPQRQAIAFPFGDDEQFRWFYTPTDHGGLPLGAMTVAQHRLTHRLVASGLSPAGYATTAAIIGLENMLDRNEGWVTEFGRERGRDPLAYWTAVFGDPASGTWAWRFGGHHVSLNFVIVDDQVVTTTPNFFGADPATTALLGPHLHRPLAGAEDLGRELVHSLDETQLAAALLAPVAPVDIVGVNRSELTEGDQPLGLPYIWRGRWDDATHAVYEQRQADAEAALGLTDDHLAALAFSEKPKGLGAAAMSADGQEMLRALLGCYLNRLPDALADEQAEKFAGTHIDSLSFAWAGGLQPSEPHYYRIHGADLFVEYDNTQRSVNHIHTVWRDLSNDFGRDVLADHYAAHRH